MVTDEKKQVSLAALTEEAKKDPQGLVRRSEAFYRQQASEIIDRFCQNFPENKVILLAGPSSSGKTTTSLHLQKELKDRGITTLAVSLDDFFFPREVAPLLEDGTPDLETIDLIDLPWMDDRFERLFSQGACDFPIFDFVKGRRSEKVRPFTLDEKTAVVIEGLHALNPVLASRPFCKNALKLYISIKTEFYEGDVRLLSTRELRMVRRIIRDANYRGCPPEDTMAMWKNVVRGEDQYIRPFRLGADFWVDSVHLYEPFLYSPFFLKMTQRVAWKQDSHAAAIARLREALGKFVSISLNFVPKDSLLREFIILP